MKKHMPRTEKKQKKQLPRDDQESTYIRDVMAALETDFDREALALIFGVGVLGDDRDPFYEAIEGLRARPSDLDEICHLQNLTVTAATVDDRRRWLMELEDHNYTELDDIRDTAYLLGIAVGRRLGSLALPSLPRARKAVA